MLAQSAPGATSAGRMDVCGLLQAGPIVSWAYCKLGTSFLTVSSISGGVS
jgi:hypothetical protein